VISAARTLVVWSIYVAVVGIGLAAVPDAMFSILGLAETNEVWVHVIGINLVLLALFYYEGSKTGSREFVLATVLGRLFVAAAFIVFWLTGEPWQLLIFAGGEIVGASWTYLALRAESA